MTSTASKTRTQAATNPQVQAELDARRAERVRMRKARQKAQRSKAIRNLLFRLICWLELLPRRIAETCTSFFVCAIVLMLGAAVFFAAYGVLVMALNFCFGFAPGW